MSTGEQLLTYGEEERLQQTGNRVIKELVQDQAVYSPVTA